MILNLSLLLPLLPLALSIPAPTPSLTSAPSFHELTKRQSLPELLALASEAGIALPTDPAALLSLYPLATQLVQYLPTSPVLSVLETAVPAGFVSSVVHDRSFAASFEQAFASGSPPSWFTALPSDVQGYLHTWQVGSLASEVGSVEAGLGAATGSLPHSIIGANATSGSARFGPLVTGASGSGSESVMVTAPSTTGGVTSASGTVLSGTNAPASSSVAAQSAAAASSGASTAAAPSSSNAGAPHQTGLLAAGMAAAVGAVFVIAL